MLDAPFDEPSYSSWRQAAAQALDCARHDQSGGFPNWACFKAQQSAEFALKALCRGLGIPAFGHSLIQLRQELERGGLSVPAERNADLLLLEQLYIPTRYPDAQPSGRPDQAYDASLAAGAVAAARRTLDFCDAARAALKPPNGPSP